MVGWLRPDQNSVEYVLQREAGEKGEGSPRALSGLGKILNAKREKQGSPEQDQHRTQSCSSSTEFMHAISFLKWYCQGSSSGVTWENGPRLAARASLRNSSWLTSPSSVRGDLVLLRSTRLSESQSPTACRSLLPLSLPARLGLPGGKLVSTSRLYQEWILSPVQDRTTHTLLLIQRCIAHN